MNTSIAGLAVAAAIAGVIFWLLEAHLRDPDPPPLMGVVFGLIFFLLNLGWMFLRNARSRRPEDRR